MDPAASSASATTTGQSAVPTGAVTGPAPARPREPEAQAELPQIAQLREALHYLSSHDQLTGLPNRSMLDERLAASLALARERHSAVALLMLSVDNYNLVNERYGYSAGDDLLTGIVQRVYGCMGSDDSLFRQGGNEFILLIHGIGAHRHVQTMAETLLVALATAFSIAGHSLHARCSVGVALAPHDGSAAGALVACANLARACAREAGPDRAQTYAPAMNERIAERSRMEAALHLALINNQLELRYQPMVDLRDGSVTGVAAQLCWRHPESGQFEACDFIAIAEQAGLAAAITAWVVQRACTDLNGWRAAGLAGVSLALSLSPRQLRAAELANHIAAALASSGVEPRQLTVEISETALLESPDASARSLGLLKALGIGLTLDRFGTVGSSLSILKRFPLDKVKIDRALIVHIANKPDDAALVKTVIAMAHHLGMLVCADGVDTESQCDVLRHSMCDLVQGAFTGAPATAVAVAALLSGPSALPVHLLRIQRQKRTLLLVDDEQNIVSSLKRLLRRDDYRILSANSGQEGLEVLAQHPVDVIVSDQRMPGMLGVDFLRAAKDLYPHTIRIMLSGYTELQSVTDAVNEGAIYKFLTKPWEDDLLRGHIADAFQVKEIADENERLNLELRTVNQELATANRKMGELLQQKQQQITLDEINLNVARELLQLLPLPVIGLDDEGFVAFVNDAAETLLYSYGAILGSEAAVVLPDLFPDGLQSGLPCERHEARIGGARYAVVARPMGAHSQSRGSLITISRCEECP